MTVTTFLCFTHLLLLCSFLNPRSDKTKSSQGWWVDADGCPQVQSKPPWALRTRQGLVLPSPFSLPSLQHTQAHLCSHPSPSAIQPRGGLRSPPKRTQACVEAPPPHLTQKKHLQKTEGQEMEAPGTKGGKTLTNGPRLTWKLYPPPPPRCSLRVQPISIPGGEAWRAL